MLSCICLSPLSAGQLEKFQKNLKRKMFLWHFIKDDSGNISKEYNLKAELPHDYYACYFKLVV